MGINDIKMSDTCHISVILWLLYIALLQWTHINRDIIKQIHMMPQKTQVRAPRQIRSIQRRACGVTKPIAVCAQCAHVVCV